MKRFNVAILIIVLAAITAIPSFISTIIRLYELGAPPVITLGDGRVIGETTLTEWPEIFGRALFYWDPPDSLVELMSGFWWIALKALALTTFLVVASMVCASKEPPFDSLPGRGLCLFAMVMVSPIVYEMIVGPKRQPYEEMSTPWGWAFLVYGLVVAMTGVLALRSRFGKVIAG